MDGHHLILGKLQDRITGETLAETHDERYRQKIAALLLDEKGFEASEIRPRVGLVLQADQKKAKITVDFMIELLGRPAMIVKYGPGSLVTRRRSALAAARLLTPFQIPVVVVTNGEDAEVLDGATGKAIAAGLAAIPSRAELIGRLSGHRWQRIDPGRREAESRIAYCYEVDGACPCDDTICRL